MESMAIGLVETIGLVPAIEGLDASLKAAEVALSSFEYVSGGLVTYIVSGEVAAVKAAVDAGGAAAGKVGTLLCTHVIARPHEEMGGILRPPAKPARRKIGTGFHRREFPVPAQPDVTPMKTAPLESPMKPQSSQYCKDQLEQMKLTDLRSLARKTPHIALKKIEIRDGIKGTLVDAILKAQEE